MISLAALVVPLAVNGAHAAQDGSGERKALTRSWADTCKRFDSQTQAAALESCNLQWFRDHEKAVWRLNLNPHNSVTPIPPPS